MKNQILKNYFMFLAPGVLTALLLYFSKQVENPVALLAVLFYAPVFMLAYAGLGQFFPSSDYHTRKPVLVIEYAVLRGLLFGIWMTSFNTLIDGIPQSVEPVIFMFVRTGAIFAVFMAAADFFQQWRWRKGQS